MKTKEQIIDEILDRGIIVDILPSREDFKKKLEVGCLEKTIVKK